MLAAVNRYTNIKESDVGVGSLLGMTLTTFL